MVSGDRQAFLSDLYGLAEKKPEPGARVIQTVRIPAAAKDDDVTLYSCVDDESGDTIVVVSWVQP